MPGREPQQLMLTVDFADGSDAFRFGPEEYGFENILQNAEFETSIPGGFGPGDFTVARVDDFDPLSLGRGLWASVVLHDVAGRIVYEGRVSATPKSGINEIEVQTEGWAKHAEDNEAASVIFVDKDLSHWIAASAQRKLALNSGGFDSFPDPTLETDFITGAPGVSLPLNGALTDPRCEAWFDSGAGNTIGSIYYDERQYPTYNTGDALFNLHVGTADDDIGTGVAYSADLAGNATNIGTHTPGTPQRWGVLRFEYGGSGNSLTTDIDRGVIWRRLAVFGNTGLTKQGTAPDQGYFASDMVVYILQRFCPVLNIQASEIEQTSFVVPQADFKEGPTARDMIESLLLLGGSSSLPLDWGVYDNKTPFVKTPGTYGRVWNLRRDEGSSPDSSGPDASERPNGIRAVWDDGTGTTKSVAPTVIGGDFTDNSLVITDPDHPANRAGLPKYKEVNMGVSTLAGATLLGQMYLADKNRMEWTGSIGAQGADGIVRDSNGNEEPVYMIRAGHRAVLGDDGDLRERRIGSTRYTSSTRTTSVDIGPQPNYFDSLLAKAGVVVNPLGFKGTSFNIGRNQHRGGSSGKPTMVQHLTLNP